MHEFSFLIPIVLIALVGGIAFLLARVHYANRLSTLRQVATIWEGHVFDGGWFDHAHAELKIGGATGRLQYSTKGKRIVTELTIHFPDPRLRLEIFPQTIVERLKKFMGMQDLEIGDPRFDELFIVQGNDANLIREYLNPDARLALEGIARSTWAFDLHLTVGGGTLRVTKQADLNQLHNLMQFVRCCEQLFAAFVAARSLGIEFLPNSAPPRISETHCQVCGEGLQGTIVFCSSCQTPHHLDCWQYVGSCSVYGCGQKRYRPARTNR